MKSGCSRVERRRVASRARASRPSASSSLVPPDVAPFVHRPPALSWPHALVDDDLLDRRRLRERLVGDLLQRHRLAAPPCAVCVSSTFAPQSLMRSRSASALKPAEDDRVRRADARAREHRDAASGTIPM